MFIINTSPLVNHRSFADYALFLFDLWVMRPYRTLKASEIHLIFDHPNRHGTSPKEIERLRRDKVDQISEFESISDDTVLPSNWRTFLSVRQQKRLLVNFLSHSFLTLSAEKITDSKFLFVTAGGFDGELTDKSLVSQNGSISQHLLTEGNHEEADTRVWLHANASAVNIVVIYSPDTDIYFIGLPILKDIDKTIYVQLKDSPYEKIYLNMNKLVPSLNNDICFQGISDIEKCVQILFIFSGCDYISYFKGYGKKSFFDVFRKCAVFISGSPEDGCLFDLNSQKGLYSFYRLISAVYFFKHSSAFLPNTSPKALFDTLQVENVHDKHLNFISEIRDKMWERILHETEMMPNPDALKLHWLRSCWVFKLWSQATRQFLVLPPLSDFGWKIESNKLECVWDIDTNFQKIRKTIDWYTKGCACKSGCNTNRCKCHKQKSESNDGYCSPGCKCINCTNIKLPEQNINMVDDDLDFSFSDVNLETVTSDFSDLKMMILQKN